ncbi:MAG: permease-like cell division protein FtsX [Candidatus Geothermincolia bacterium]
MINLRYFSRETFDSLRKNVILAIAAISVVAVSLGILGMVVMGWDMFANMIKNTERKVGEIDVFLEDGLTEADRTTLEAFIRSIPEVDPQQVQYKSKEQALQEFKERFADNPELWEFLDENPLPASFTVMAKDPKDVGVVVSRIANDNPTPAAIDDIKAASSAIERLENVFGKFRTIGSIAVGGLIIVAVLLVSVTIQVAIFARRREVGIMKLVGATNWFIRWPFILEGILEGIIGAIIAVLVVGMFKVYILDKLSAALPFLRMDTSASLLYILFIAIAVGGIVIGALGSIVALRRYLEV